MSLSSFRIKLKVSPLSISSVSSVVNTWNAQSAAIGECTLKFSYLELDVFDGDLFLVCMAPLVTTFELQRTKKDLLKAIVKARSRKIKPHTIGIYNQAIISVSNCLQISEEPELVKTGFKRIRLRPDLTLISSEP